MEKNSNTISDLISRFTGLFSNDPPKDEQSTPEKKPAQNQVLPPYPKDKATLDFLHRHDELKNKIIK